MRLLSTLPIVLSLTSFLAAGSLAAQEGEPGSVVAWGDHLFANMFAVPVIVPEGALSGVTAIAAGSAMSGVAKTDGTFLFWTTFWPDQTDTFTHPKRGTIKQFIANPIYADHRYPDMFAALYQDGSVEEIAFYVGWPSDRPQRDSLKSGVTAITFGKDWLLASKEDGTVLIDGKVDPFAPVIPGGARALASLERAETALALRADGTVVSWIPNSAGKPLPVPLAAQRDVVAIASGSEHFLALKADGSVVSWHAADPSNLSAGPKEMPLVAQSGVKAIAAGNFGSLALKTDDTIVALSFGLDSSDPKLTAVQGTVTALACGQYHALALVAPRPPTLVAAPASQSVKFGHSASLTVSATGPNHSYQWMRDGEAIPGGNARTFPLKFAAPGSFSVVVSNPFGAVTSSPPAIVTVVPAAPGAVLGLGAGTEDLGGWYDEGQSLIPPEAEEGVVAVAGGETHSLALKTDGSVIVWGGYPSTPSPLPMPARRDFVAIAAGGHSLGLTRDGTVIGWGENASGQSSPPAGLEGAVTAIAAGGGHSLALKRDGSVIAWGFNTFGQTNVPATARSNVVAIAAGGAHSLALKADGSVIAWGGNQFGQTDVPELARHGVVAIAAGQSHSLALTKEGTVVAWGQYVTEVPGAGVIDVPTAARSGVVAIAAGGKHSLALKADGTVVTWGFNTYGQSEIPRTIQGGVSGISAGWAHTLLIVGTAALQSKPTATGIELSWPATLAGFHVQMASSLEAAATWTNVDDEPAVAGDRRVLARPVGAEPRWYRLSR